MELIIIGLIAVEVVLVRLLFWNYVPVHSDEMKYTIGIYSGRTRTGGALLWEAGFRKTALETVYNTFNHFPTPCFISTPNTICHHALVDLSVARPILAGKYEQSLKAAQTPLQPLTPLL